MGTPVVEDMDWATLSVVLFRLMMRNVATDGFPFTDPDPSHDVGGLAAISQPGAIIASPSYAIAGGPADDREIDQNYVYSWTRDSAIVAMEIAANPVALADPSAQHSLSDYVRFSRTCQNAASVTDAGLANACYLVDGRVRTGWRKQNDGPALQALAILGFYDRLDAATKEIAAQVIADDVQFVVSYWMNSNSNLWEEVAGKSYFTSAVQLQCLRALKGNGSGLPVPAAIDDAIAHIETLLQGWPFDGACFTSIVDPVDTLPPGYDPNIDIVLASIYGAIPVTDPRLITSAATIREQWAGSTGTHVYPINVEDRARDIGPLLGRYPRDGYDGNDSDGRDMTVGHPWFVSTACFAELYYRLAVQVEVPGAVADFDGLFWRQIEVEPTTPAADVAGKLREAGDRMLRAVVAHSDYLELSEQIDATTGAQRSVLNLTWSFAAVLSAIRARNAAALARP